MSRFALSLIVCLVGCAASDGRARDSCFDRAWVEDARNSEVQSRDEYLAHVQSFYEGSLFIPGWSRRQAELCASLDPADAAVAASRLDELGRLLASEWAKDNRYRRIDSDELFRFAGMLAEGREGGHLVATVEEVLEEAKSLVAGGIQTSRR